VTSNTDFKVTIIRGRSRSLKMAPFDRAYDFLSVSHCKYSSMLHHFCAIAYLEWLTNRKSYALSNGTIFNDLERPLPPVSRSRHSLTLNISETVRDTQFQWNTNRDVLLDSVIGTSYWTVLFRMSLNDLPKYSTTQSVARSRCNS